MTYPPASSGPHDGQPDGQPLGPSTPFGQWQPAGQLPGYAPWSPPARPVPPRSVIGAFLLSLLSFIVGAGSTALTLTEQGRADMRREFGGDQPGLSPAELDAMVRVSVVITVGMLILLSAFSVFLSFKIRAGRDWARVVWTALSGLSIAALAVAVAAAPEAVDWLGVVDAALGVLVVVLLYQAPSNRYFRESNQFRAYQLLHGDGGEG